jgi:hypothetical protein
MGDIQHKGRPKILGLTDVIKHADIRLLYFLGHECNVAAIG